MSDFHEQQYYMKVIGQQYANSTSDISSTEVSFISGF